MMDESTSTTATTVEAPAKKAVTRAARAKKKAAKKTLIPHGKAYIHATYNNTILSLTDLNGNVLSWSSAGSCGFTGPKKSTPYAASMVVKKAVEKAAPYGIKEVNLIITGVGQGREGAIRAFHANGIAVLSIKDMTPIPHNGCRPPRPRRV